MGTHISFTSGTIMLKVSFNFDEDSKQILNFKVIESSDPPKKYADIKIPIIELENNKLIISPCAANLLNIKYKDKIAINYMQSNHVVYPVIGRAEMFADKEAGCKLTKSNTVLFKGTQNKMLMQYGSLFRLAESTIANVFILTPINKNEIE